MVKATGEVLPEYDPRVVRHIVAERHESGLDASDGDLSAGQMTPDVVSQEQIVVQGQDRHGHDGPDCYHGYQPRPESMPAATYSPLRHDGQQDHRHAERQQIEDRDEAAGYQGATNHQYGG